MGKMRVKSKVEGGEIIQVQGGHIIRSTGRKDRHSKVFTAKGARDRRVRLAAHTAIQFYDVQDRLGFDRPSKAVDWLINKAKASIDKLAELPPWDPTNTNIDTNTTTRDVANYHDCHNVDNNDNVGSSKEMSLGGDNSLGVSQFYVPQFLESHAFLPTNSLSFQNYPHELISKVSSQNNQDLCLSLHTLQDPREGGSGHVSHLGHDHGLFHGFDGGWAQTQQQDIGRFTRLMGWTGDSGGAGEGLLLNQQGLKITNYTQNQRSTLQSSYSHLARPFEDNHNRNYSNCHHHESISNAGHGSEGFMGLYIPPQIRGDLHGVTSISNRTSSSSLSDSSQH